MAADLGYAGGPAALDFNALLAHDRRRGALAAGRAPACAWATCTCTSATSTQGLAFYRDVLGFEVQANLGSAAFVSAGGYHHHLGFNVWRGQGVGPAPEHTVGLRHWTSSCPADESTSVRARVDDAEDIDGGFLTRDPWGTAVAFVA